MPRYSVWAYVEDIRKSLGPFCVVLNEQQMRRRARAGLELLQCRIKEVPHVDGIIEHRGSASVTITTSADVSEKLRSLELGFIELGDAYDLPPEVKAPAERLFSIVPSYASRVTFTQIEAVVTALGGHRHPKILAVFVVPTNGEKDPFIHLFAVQAEFSKRNVAVVMGLAH